MNIENRIWCRGTIEPLCKDCNHCKPDKHNSLCEHFEPYSQEELYKSADIRAVSYLINELKGELTKNG